MDADTRVEVIRRRQQYEEQPEEFLCRWTEPEEELRNRIVRAQALLPSVTISDAMLHVIARICIDMGVDGHRADITMMKTASTIAAYHGRTEVTEEDVREAATLVLSHRMRRRPFSEQRMDVSKVDQSIQKTQHSHSHQNGHVHPHSH
jgi:Mg-chelatase subunit ChlI